MADGRRRDLWAHTSSVLALVANVNRDPKKGRPFSPADFNPFESVGKGGGIPITADNIRVLKALVPGGTHGR